MTGMFNKIGINSTAFPSLSPEQKASFTSFIFIYWADITGV